MRSGHLVIDSRNSIVRTDYSFGALMQSDVASLIGRPVLDITAPADRIECGEAIRKLRTTRTAFELTKRFIRDDGSLVWVTNTVSLVGDGGSSDLIVATISPVDTTNISRAPALLLDSARALASLHYARSKVFDPSILSYTGWTAILTAYVAEAEGRAVTVCALATLTGISVPQAQRWISVLIGQGVMEIETRQSDPSAPKSFRLTQDAHRRFEDHLENAGTLLGARSRAPLAA